MNEVKIIQKKFGCIATSLDDGSDIPLLDKLAAIRSWKPASEKIRVFGTLIDEESGVSNAKMKQGHPTLRAMVEDHVKGIRSQGALIIAPPTVKIEPICIQLTEWAARKNMGIAWVFHAADKKVWGMTPSVAKVLANETPEHVLFKGAEWSTWLEGWVAKYIQPHRRFEADQFNLASDWLSKEECECKGKKKCKTKHK